MKQCYHINSKIKGVAVRGKDGSRPSKSVKPKDHIGRNYVAGTDQLIADLLKRNHCRNCN